ncbi:MULTISPECIES: DUF2795 domain-containing protein [unclassified Streptomyces]|uniref:DUF2795 domain-containing protein n=1 Tax=unclassified Streptomyces TaxID=2593676 RepID=UPI0036FDE0AA
MEAFVGAGGSRDADMTPGAAGFVNMNNLDMLRAAGSRAAGLLQFFEGLSYPATRQQLIEHVEKNPSADKSLGDAVKKLPDRKFTSAADVTEALGAG